MKQYSLGENYGLKHPVYNSESALCVVGRRLEALFPPKCISYEQIKQFAKGVTIAPLEVEYDNVLFSETFQRRYF